MKTEMQTALPRYSIRSIGLLTVAVAVLCLPFTSLIDETTGPSLAILYIAGFMASFAIAGSSVGHNMLGMSGWSRGATSGAIVGLGFLMWALLPRLILN